jgi:alpha-tubulin suppressor-like RCC1 family protein
VDVLEEDGAPLSGVAAVAVGGRYTCALTTAGTVKCWGQNAWGQLGDGTTTTTQLTPVDVLEEPDGAPLSGLLAHWAHSEVRITRY